MFRWTHSNRLNFRYAPNIFHIDTTSFVLRRYWPTVRILKAVTTCYAIGLTPKIQIPLRASFSLQLYTTYEAISYRNNLWSHFKHTCLRLCHWTHSQLSEFIWESLSDYHFNHLFITIQNLDIVKIDAENNLICIKGGIPGAKGSLVMLRDAVKA